MVTLVVLTLYILFLIEEGLRLSHNCEARPLIILEKIEEENNLIYKSLGFKIVLRDWQLENKQLCSGQEFWFFDSIMIWGWIS